MEHNRSCFSLDQIKNGTLLCCSVGSKNFIRKTYSNISWRKNGYQTLHILISKTTLLIRNGRNRMVTMKCVYHWRLIKESWTSPCTHTQTLFESKIMNYTTEIHKLPDDFDKMNISIDCSSNFLERWVVLADAFVRNSNNSRLGWISYSVGRFPILLRSKIFIWTVKMPANNHFL